MPAAKTTPSKKQKTARVPRRAVDKFSERREELAQAALKTLSELGYARTSLREIAQNSDFSHGVLHYYFADKVDLIMYCVKRYKAQCMTRYDDIVASAQTAEALRRGLGAGMAETLRADATLHRLWYDLRTQSLFEASFRSDVTEIDRALERMIWRIVSQYAELSGRALALSSPLAYALFDGLFQQALLRQLAGHAEAAPELDRQVRQVLSTLVLAAPAAAPRLGEKVKRLPSTPGRRLKAARVS